MSDSVLRELPSVHAILAALGEAAEPRPTATAAVRQTIDQLRHKLRQGAPAPTFDHVVEAARQAIAHLREPSLRRVINATGVILQTNLGRSPLPERALDAIRAVAGGYSNLEYQVEDGERGSRHVHLGDVLRRATGAEDGIAVNNNAAALFMVLQVLAAGREVVISRGQAVEIGGGFRIPDVMRQSGARLVEVGTTNRTYARDYAAAITADTAAVLRVHASNFRVVGFTAEPSVAELAAVAHERAILLLDDLGSGSLVDTTRFGMQREPTVQHSLVAGADIVLFSGDKLLGGPQAGILVGRAAPIAKLRSHPLARALRVDKLTIAALSATLQIYLEGREEEEIPVWRMVAMPLAAIRRRARRWAAAAGAAGSIVASRSMVGGGSLPGEGVDTWCTAVSGSAGAEVLARALRSASPPVIPRIEGGQVLLDPRTVDPSDDTSVVRALVKALA